MALWSDILKTSAKMFFNSIYMVFFLILMRMFCFELLKFFLSSVLQEVSFRVISTFTVLILFVWIFVTLLSIFDDKWLGNKEFPA